MIITSELQSHEVRILCGFYNYYRTALSVEDVVRRNGVVPATIGIINGSIHIG